MHGIWQEEPEPGPAPGRRLLDRLGTTPAEAWRSGVGYLLGATGALLFLVWKLPLPWFLGSLTFCLIASVLRVPVARPQALSAPVRVVLGVTIGTAFTPALFDDMAGMLGSLLLLVPFMYLIIWAGRICFERYAGFDKPTAFFCAVPGGLTDMVSMAADSGANVRAVTLVQATRIVMIVFLLPFWLRFSGHQGIGGAMPPGVHLAEFLLMDAIVLVALGWAGWRLAGRLGLAGAPLVGPMILSGVAHGLGLTSAKVPVEVMIFAQVTLGIGLGAQFRGVTPKEFYTTMKWGIGFSLLLVLVTGLVAVAVSRLTGFDSTTVLLAYAPGGQTELNLLAFILGLDVAFTALHHLVRLAVVIFGAQLVYAANRQWRSGPGSPAGQP